MPPSTWGPRRGHA